MKTRLHAIPDKYTNLDGFSLSAEDRILNEECLTEVLEELEVFLANPTSTVWATEKETLDWFADAIADLTVIKDESGMSIGEEWDTSEYVSPLAA